MPDNAPKTGLLGADYKVENGRYRIAKILGGQNWTPGLASPLTLPGVYVKEGEYLLAVNGRELHASDNLYEFFDGTAGKQTVLHVGPNPDGKDARDVTVVPIGDEDGLRNIDWVESNRRKVDELSGGKVAYVYMPNTGGSGYTNFNRYFYSQLDKQALVLDERWNEGGFIADYVVDVLKRFPLSGAIERDGKPIHDPGGRHLRAQGHAHQPELRLRRRRHALVLPQGRHRQAGGHAHLGRTGRHRRLSVAARRRLRHGPALRHLRPARRLGSGEPRHRRPTCRSRSCPRTSPPATTCNSKPASKLVLDELEGQSRPRHPHPTLPQLPQERRVRDQLVRQASCKRTQMPGAPGPDFGTWDTKNLGSPRNGNPIPPTEAGCPTFGASLFLRLRWDISNLSSSTLNSSQICHPEHIYSRKRDTPADERGRSRRSWVPQVPRFWGPGIPQPSIYPVHHERP